MKEKKAIKDYFDKKKRKPCHVGHIEHTNECPHCVAIHGYKIKIQLYIYQKALKEAKLKKRNQSKIISIKQKENHVMLDI